MTLFYKEVLPGSTRVRVSVDGSLIKDAQGNNVDADGDGAAGGNAVLEFDTLSLTVIPGTAVCGRVFASELAVNASNVSVNTPLKDVTVSVDGLELQTKTDVNGNFCLNPAPAGRFFVHVDGHSATNIIPAGQFYPMVGKAWQSIPGQTTNVGDIYLPLVPPNTLQPVSAAQDTQITFADAVLQAHPDLNGVSILVPADSLFSDDGARGGRVGIAPVPPDRLPGGLPEGLNFPVVITVQTDGAGNFDTPAPVCFPNLPDTTTGQPLPTGSKSALWSFDHDTGGWVIVGPMTVSADGKLVCTDAGVGIRAPGWHGSQEATSGSGGQPEKAPPPPEICQPPRARSDYAPESNGCGAKGDWKSNFIPNDPVRSLSGYIGSKDTSFLSACNSHDICWGTCQGNINAATYKASCDQEFEDNMLLTCAHLDEPLTALYFLDCILYSQIYAAAVRSAQGPFDSAQRDACETCEDARSNEMISTPSDGSMESRFFYAVINIDTNEVVQRGQTDSNNSLLNNINLAPNTKYQLAVFQVPEMLEGEVDFSSPSNGLSFTIPPVVLAPTVFWDLDTDSLTDSAEAILGTDIFETDTDTDGISDGAEVAQGTDPLGGFIAQTGIIGSADTPGTAVDICVQNDMAVVADSAAGVAIFNVFDSQNPKLIAQVDTPGNAQRVACVDGRVAVADGDSGLAIMDISNAATARIVHQLNLNGEVTAVTNAGNVAYAATAAGRVVAVDITTGAVLSEVTLPEGVQDLSLQAEYLYALTTQKLYALALQNNSLTLAGSADSPGQVGVGGRPWRLFVGGSLAYATHTQGYNTFDLTLPGQPVLLKAGQTQQFGWKQIVTNGAGVGVAAVGPNSTNDGPHNISLYDVSDPKQTDKFITQFETPGLAAAVTLYNGRAYVADSEAGMQVINYLAYDNQKAPPTITLSTNFASGKAEEGAIMRITATTTDDVQVRNVEFYVDGKLVATDGSFPFEYRFITPRIADQPSFKLRVRAMDTGGNETWTDEQTITLVVDATPPRVISVIPISATNPIGSVSKVTITFNEAINASTLTPQNFALFSIGADKFLGTSDDVVISGGSIAYTADTKTASLTFAAPLPLGIYRIVMSIALTDLAGNSLAKSFSRDFDITELLLEDNFNSEGPLTVNYSNFLHWNVTRGSADLIGPGFFDFYPGNGFYLDLDGSTRTAVRLESKIDFLLQPADYRLSFMYGNNPNGSNTNTMSVALGNAFSTTLSVTGASALQPFNQVLTIDKSTTGKLVFDHSGGDNDGIILDNVKLERISTQTGNILMQSTTLAMDDTSNTRRNGN